MAKTKRNSKLKLNKLARLKLQYKELEAEIDALTKELFPNAEKKTETPYGTLVREERVNWSVPDNDSLIRETDLTSKMFINLAKIAGGNIKKALGEVKFAKAVKSGLVVQGSPSRYFKLNKPKEE